MTLQNHIKRLLLKMWKCTCEVSVSIANAKILDKKRFFFVKNKQKGKYVEK